jgi:uncharacterized membrane protein
MGKSIDHKLIRIITLLAGVWCTGILAAPVLRHAGFPGCADIIYSAYARVCHQNDVLSFHLEGEKFGVCIRCSAIYFGFLAGLLSMLLVRTLEQIRLPDRRLIIAVMVPMLVDVVLNDTGLHLSTTVTRLATGILFGCVIPWCLVPLFIESYVQLYQKKKIQSIDTGVKTYVRKTQ